MTVAARVSSWSRRRKIALFREHLRPGPSTTILDVGADGEEVSWTSANPLVAAHPWPAMITATGLGSGGFRLAHPQVAWVESDARALPFADGSFELVHCNAVVEHLRPDDQRLLLAECCRVAYRAAFVTTPNRLFPIEVHTRIPFVHWLPWSIGGSLLRRFRPVLGGGLWLLTPAGLRALVPTTHAVETVRRGMTIVVIARPVDSVA